MHPTTTARRALGLVAALALPLALAAQTPDARENGTPVGTYWASGLTPAAVAAQISQG